LKTTIAVIGNPTKSSVIDIFKVVLFSVTIVAIVVSPAEVIVSEFPLLDQVPVELSSAHTLPSLK